MKSTMIGNRPGSLDSAQSSQSAAESVEENRSVNSDELESGEIARKTMPMFSSASFLQSIKEDPEVRKNLRNMCIKSFKINLQMQKVELHNRYENLDHQRRKNAMELEFNARRNEHELEYQRRVQALELVKHERELGFKRPRAAEHERPAGVKPKRAKSGDEAPKECYTVARDSKIYNFRNVVRKFRH